MKLVTIIVARSKSCSVKTLHSILRLNLRCIQTNINNEIAYVDDDPFKKAEIIQSYMKKCDRILFIDFGIGVDDETLKQCIQPHEGVGCLVFPGVQEGVDWELFKNKINEGSDEPVNEMGLHYDTSVGKKISENIYNVVQTEARCWMMNPSLVIKKIKDKKTGSWKINPNGMFEKLKKQGVKIYAFTASKLTITYAHECISNILNAAGVKVSST